MPLTEIEFYRSTLIKFCRCSFRFSLISSVIRVDFDKFIFMFNLDNGEFVANMCA